MDMASDERATQWVMDRTRESLANPAQFLQLLANPNTANLLSALRADAGLLPKATRCSAEGSKAQGTSEPTAAESGGAEARNASLVNASAAQWNAAPSS